MHKLSDPVLRVNAGDVSAKGAGKYPEILAPLESAKRFFRFEEPRGSPAQCHVGIAIATNTPTDTAHGTIRILVSHHLVPTPPLVGTSFVGPIAAG